MPRYFYFWCERCPTRITVETEVPPGQFYPLPEYNFAESEWVGLAQARPPTSGDDGLEAASLCPACGGQLHDWDDLAGRETIPYCDEKDVSKVHADWREKVRKGT